LLVSLLGRSVDPTWQGVPAQVKAKQDADALRKENDGLRLEISKWDRQAAELKAELASAKVSICFLVFCLRMTA
jgi:hypothetical protein